MEGWPVRCGCWPLSPALLLPALQHCCWLRPLAGCLSERLRRRWLFSGQWGAANSAARQLTTFPQEKGVLDADTSA
ncbi:hypothetical protein A4R35_04135 [Thermogemmatispora tikiterensis]|uniref:Uncharacterized protein n=1 Tax=Thermogemmatispora tikiterensis TaxID=1825093 RepID=A0A328VF87_9CHLR|nr:hypothetical protein A4R35_04135 [Thermogemmatispora tikiterensis]